MTVTPKTYLLAIDQGTTNSKAILFDSAGFAISQYACDLKQSYLHNGWVEQDPEEMFANVVLCCRQVIQAAGISPKAIAGIGISNQRETTIIWEKKTGKPIYPAIVWQDRRTHDICKQLSSEPIANVIPKKTGLLLDPYFSATKIMWLLDHIPKARQQAEAHELLFGTVDTYLLWKLTQGRSHLTDVTNASRTLLFNIHTLQWDREILSALAIPESLLPTVCHNTADFGDMHSSILGESIPILALAGDQQAATIGQACLNPGMIKATYGTGGFLLLNTGDQVIESHYKLLSTIAYGVEGHVTYGLEGSIFCAGTTIKWLRDTLKIINTAAETEELARGLPDTDGVHFVPAFTGIGAPYWQPEARGAILGLTRASSREHIVRAALESVAYQTRDLLEVMIADSAVQSKVLRVDGGMAANSWLLQFISDILQVEVQRPQCIETSALGVAYLAGLQAGIYTSLHEIAERWQSAASFFPAMSKDQGDHLYAGWQRAIQRIL